MFQRPSSVGSLDRFSSGVDRIRDIISEADSAKKAIQKYKKSLIVYSE